MLPLLASAAVLLAVSSDGSEEEDPEELLELLGEKPVWATFIPELVGPSGDHNFYTLRSVRGEYPRPWVFKILAELGMPSDYPDEIRFNIRRLVVGMSTEELESIHDDQGESDRLWLKHPISQEKPWRGPFKIEAEEAIEDYLKRERGLL